MKKNLFIIYFLLLGTTVFLWLNAKSSLDFLVKFPALSFAQIAGLLACTLLALNFLLAARLRVFENLFHGLDKVYKQHQFTGKFAFILILAHPTLLAISALPYPRLLSLYFISLSEPAWNYGKLAFLGFTLLVTLTIYIRLPYHIWRRTHQMMIIPLIFAVLHVLNVSSDVAVSMPLRYWILGLLTTGAIAYTYKVILYKFVGPRLPYKISQVSLKGQITEILLTPVKNALNYEPGQFVFAVFGNPEVGPEEHPFSVSSSPTQNLVRLSVKKSGDFTAKLSVLKKGDKVLLYGPYGQFGRQALMARKDLVLIAGGIGVTPFLSIVNYIADQRIDKTFDLYYVFSNNAEGVYAKELSSAVQKTKKGKLLLHVSDIKGRITAETIAKTSGNITQKTILLCGPKAMMASLTEQFLALGVKRRNIIFEDFDLKG